MAIASPLNVDVFRPAGEYKTEIAAQENRRRIISRWYLRHK